jgi:hypothetical protein
MTIVEGPGKARSLRPDETASNAVADSAVTAMAAALKAAGIC